MSSIMSKSVPLLFDQQPLAEASARMVFAGPVSLTVDTLQRVATTLAELKHDVRSYNSGPDPLSLFTLNIGSQLLFHSAGTDTEVRIDQGGVVVYWHEGLGTRYPRFQRIREVAEAVVSSFRSPQIAIVNMSYVTHCAGRAWKDIVALHVGGFGDGLEVTDLNIAFKAQQIEYRVQAVDVVGPGQESMARLQTVGGVRLVEHEDPIQRLQFVNEQMNLVFQSLITDQAKEDWN